MAYKRGVELSPSLLSRLYANEREKAFASDFLRRMKTAYNIDFPQKNFSTVDFVKTTLPIKADILVGNPPWKTL